MAEKNCKEFGYLAYSDSSLLLEALLFMVLSRRPEEKSVAARNGSSAAGLGCCWQNRWPRSGAGLTAAPIQRVCYAKQDQAGPTVAWQRKKGMLCRKGAGVYFECPNDHVPQWVRDFKYDHSS